MKFLKHPFFLVAILVGLAAWGCAAGGGPLWDPDHRSDNDWDDDDDWRYRRGDWDDRRDGDWEDRPNPRSTDRRKNYWDDRNWGDDSRHDYWTWGTQSYAVPRTSEMTSIRTLSHTLDQTADELMDELRHDSHLADTLGRPDGPAAKMRTSADSFHLQVESNMTRPDRTLSGYQQAKSSHTRLAEAASRRNLNNRMERQMDRIDETVVALDRLYLRPRR
jgi:hypothetical protein